MQERDFVFWLNGFFELSGATTLDEQQVQVIKEHLALVMTKTTPSTVQPYVPTYPSYPMPSDKGWEITCQTVNSLGIPNCDCHGIKKEIPIVDVPTCLTC
jgi:hypothetical protein